MITKNITDKIKYYIYLYSDPDSNKIFYVGKGNKNRLFSHLYNESDSKVNKKIKDIRKRGKEPKIEILIHGLDDEKTALRVESSIIDLLGINNLANQVRGYESSKFGRMSVDELIATYVRKPANITEPSILIRINKLFRYSMSPSELYDVTRGIWKVGERKEKAKFCFAVYDGIIQEVYSIKQWFPAGTTFTSRNIKGRVIKSSKDAERWEFIGNIAEESIRKKYWLKSVEELFSKGNQNPIKYVNI